eukprot:COSAG01_NODE_40317_length_465_cov_0.852459_1_plen_75_part_00
MSSSQNGNRLQRIGCMHASIISDEYHCNQWDKYHHEIETVNDVVVAELLYWVLAESRQVYEYHKYCAADAQQPK